MPRAAAPRVATNFFDSKKRVIYVSATGKYFVNGNSGTQYNPKAAFARNSNGNPVSLNGRNIPSAIRAAIRKANIGLASMKIVGQRKTRNNKGVARGPQWMPKNHTVLTNAPVFVAQPTPTYAIGARKFRRNISRTPGTPGAGKFNRGYYAAKPAEVNRMQFWQGH